MAGENNQVGLDYVHPTAVTAWQLIGSVIGVFVIIVVAAWTIVTNEAANNKAITDDLKLNYVTKSNHDDLVNRFIREVSRVDKIGDETLPRKEYEAWKKEHDKAIADIKNELKIIRENNITRKEFDGVVNERGEQIKSLRSESDSRTRLYVTKEEMSAHSAADVERVQALRREVDALRSEFKKP